MPTSAARALADAHVHVTVIDRHNYHLFQPLLYQVATASLSPGDIASPIRWVLRRQQNVQVLLAEVQRIDPDRRSVILNSGPEQNEDEHVSVPYDYLIVATGATHAYFGHPEWAARAPGLKTLGDALEIRRRILVAFERAEREANPERQRELLTFVLVGGGPTGVELAGTLAEIARQTLRDEYRAIDTGQARIVLVEAGESILPSFPDRLRRAVRSGRTGSRDNPLFRGRRSHARRSLRRGRASAHHPRQGASRVGLLPGPGVAHMGSLDFLFIRAIPSRRVHSRGHARAGCARRAS